MYRHRAMLLILWIIAGVILLGGFDHMEDDDQERGYEEMREVVEALEREEKVNGWRDNAQSDTW